jgi:hypothetical protein
MNAQYLFQQNKMLNTVEDVVLAIIQQQVIEPNKAVFDRGHATVVQEQNMSAWNASVGQVLDEMKVPVTDENLEMLADVGKELKDRGFWDKGTKLDEDTRKEISRIYIAKALQSKSNKPSVDASKPPLFKKPTATGNTGKPTSGNAPRRKKAPRTMGGIGTSSGKSGEVRSKVSTIFDSEFTINQ